MRSVDFNLNLDLIGRQIESDLEGAAVQTLHVVLKDTEPYVPYNTGELSDSEVIDEDSLSIVWDAEHAEYVYDMPKSTDFNRTTHDKATSKWVDEALASYKNKWVGDLKKNFAGRR